MNNKVPLTVAIIALNEELNIARAIKSAHWAGDVLVVDSGSTDSTVRIAQELGARVVHNPWLGYGQQKNFAQHHSLHDWVFSLDADEEISKELKESLINELNQPKHMAYRFPRKTWYLGRWILHGGWYPNSIIRLSHRKYGRWTEPKVHEQLLVQGTVGELCGDIYHYPFKNIHEQITTNLNFSRLGAEQMENNGYKPSLVMLILKPIGKFFETYLIKLGMLDGLPGFIISVNAAHSMFLKYAYPFEKVLCDKKNTSS